MRLFIASDLNEAVVERIMQLKASTTSGFAGGLRWVKPVNLHITLAFLGEVPAERGISGIIKSIDAVSGVLKKVPLTIGGLGAFPSIEQPRALWLGLKSGSDGAAAVSARLREDLAAQGFRFRDAFAGHITIARASSRPDGTALQLLAAKAAEMEMNETMGTLNLMRSLNSGPDLEYRILYSKELL